MDFGFLTDYLAIGIIVICLCIGYVIKISLTSIPNKYIPLIMLILGTVLNVWANASITIDVVLVGMISGLSSTGFHEAFRSFIEKNKEE